MRNLAPLSHSTAAHARMGLLLRQGGVMLLCWLAGTAACAQNLNTNAAHFKVVQIETNWRIGADLLSQSEVLVVREALTGEGAVAIGKHALFYNKGVETLELLEAYTIKPDGKRITVGAEAIQKQSGVAAAGVAASWPDAEILQVTFPDVQKGDRTYLRSRTSHRNLMLPGWAAMQDYLVPVVSFDSFKMRIEAPQSVALNVSAKGLTMTRSPDGHNDVWQIQGQSSASVVDNNPANTLQVFPRVMVSTFKDHGQLAQAYASQANAKAVVTDEIKALSAGITRGLDQPHDKARALHDWVRKNIRYVAVYLGVGGWVPHDVDWILKKRYGDCKDHVLLLQTLLKAVGIEAVPVLINTHAEYVLTELPVANSFNHAIVYIPGLNVFVDPTDARISFGALPWQSADKPVAVALGSGGKLMRTPAFKAEHNRLTLKSVWHIAADGKARLSLSVDALGFAATTLQDRLLQIPAGMSGTAVQRILEASRLRGSGFAQYPAVQREVQQQSFNLQADIDDLLTDPLAGSINPHPGLNLPLDILSNMGNYSAGQRSYATTCTPVALREEFELQFDPAYKITRVPQDVSLTHNDGVTFAAQYRKEGNTLKGWRELTLSHQRHVCTPADYDDRKETFNRIAQHLRSSVLYQQQ